jgi:transcription elongation factor GreA
MGYERYRLGDVGTMHPMVHDPSAPGLLRAVGLLADGPVPWGRPVPARGPGVFLVELSAPRPSAPIELSRVGKWLERVDSLRLDGERPASRALAARLAAFWLPSQVVLYVGATATSVGARVRSMRETPLGDRRPHPGGHWLHVLTALDGARIWWAATDAVEEYEDAVLSEFGAGVPDAERAALPDSTVVLPFANLRTPTGARKATGLTGSLITEPVVAVPETRIVQVPDGEAEGARGEPPARTPRPARPVASSPRPAGATRAIAPKAELARPSREAEEVHLTPDGAARLQAELRTLIEERRPEVVGRIRAAKELGDLKENADYTAAREEQSFLEGRIQSIEGQLRGARIIVAPTAGAAIGIGSSITVETAGEETVYVLVGSTEADPSKGRISVASPVGKALLGHQPGDEVVVRTPRGEAHYRIVDVG